MQANTKQARKLLRAAISKSNACVTVCNKEGVRVLRTLTELSRANDAVQGVDTRRFIVFMLQADNIEQLHEVYSIAENSFKDEGFNNKLKLTGAYTALNGTAYAYLRCAATIA